MSAGRPMGKTYTAVFVWLVIFTAIELAATFAGLERHLLIAVLLATTAGKAALIALYFMHLRFEGPLVWLLPGIAVFFVLFFVAGIYPDIALHLHSKW